MAFKRLPVVTKLFKEHSPKIAFRALAHFAPDTYVEVGEVGSGVTQVKSGVISDGTLYALAQIGAFNSRVYKSEDQGKNFTACGTFPSTQEKVYDIVAANDGSLVVIGKNGSGKLNVHRSTNDGTSWTETFEQDNTAVKGEVGDKLCVAPNGSVYFAARMNSGPTPCGVWRSTNNGASFTQVTIAGTSQGTCTVLAASNGFVHTASEDDNIFRSTNNGSSYSSTYSGSTGGKMAMEENTNTGTLFISAASNRYFRSTNDGASWTLTTSVNSTHLLFVDSEFTLWKNNSTSDGLLKSTNDGVDFTEAPALPDATCFFEMVEDSNYLYGFGINGKLYISNNMGGVWNTYNP